MDFKGTAFDTTKLEGQNKSNEIIDYIIERKVSRSISSESMMQGLNWIGLIWL